MNAINLQLPTRLCLHCLEPYRPKRKKQKYCSDACGSKVRTQARDARLRASGEIRLMDVRCRYRHKGFKIKETR